MSNFTTNSKLYLVACFLAICVAGCGGSDGPKRYPVEGSVLINGKPTVGVMVQFEHADPSVEGNYRFPTAVTGEDGSFSISSSGEKDGAVEGDYSVTLMWLSANDLSAYDMLGGKYADKAKPAFQVTVKAEDNQLDPFDLTIKESEIKKKNKKQAGAPAEMRQ